MNRTAAFLGAGAERRRATVEYCDMAGPFGGSHLIVQGDGRARLCVVDVQAAERRERRYAGSVDAENLFEALVAADVVDLRLTESTGLPDQVRMSITITNAAGRSHTVAAWEEERLPSPLAPDSPRARFDAARLALRKLRAKLEEAESPVFDAPCEPLSRARWIGGPEGAFDLVEPGRIEISGGCEMYTEGALAFLPDDAHVVVTLGNAEPYGYFLEEGEQRVPDFSVSLKAAEAARFFERVAAVIDSPQPAEQPTTADMRVDVHLPLRGRLLTAHWEELAGPHDVEPLLQAVWAFVLDIAPRP